jgi:hypothetical protein
VQVRVDLTQYPETYYFRDGDEQAALPAVLGVAGSLRRAAAQAPRLDARVAGELLGYAIDDLAAVVDQQFLRCELDPAQVLTAYATDHGHRSAD